MKSKKKSVVYKYNYYDETGKRRCKSFSAPTMKEAMFRAMMWEREHPKTGSKLTVRQAVERYIESRRNIIAASTMRTYSSMQSNHLEVIGDIPICDISKNDLQAWVSALAAKVSPKTVKNYWLLLRPALEEADESFRVKVSLPEVRTYENYCPSDSDISALLAYIRKGNDKELLAAVLLAAFGPLRRSEICALTSNDIKGNVVTVNKAKVRGEFGEWIIKTPKTEKSARRVIFPDFVISEIKGFEGNLISCSPDALGERFRSALKKVDVPEFRFHDLRHYSASIMMYMGISQRTIEQRGGWSVNSHTLKKTYQNVIENEMKKENDKINDYFSSFSI